jgi:hypothetical protein
MYISLVTFLLICVRFSENPLLSAILRRSILEMDELVLSDQDDSRYSLKHRLHFGYLSTCIGWPEGMHTILDYMRNQSLVLKDPLVLWHAFYLQDWECFDILSQAGFRIAYPIFEVAVDAGGAVMRHVTSTTVQQSDTLQDTNQSFRSAELDLSTSFHTELNIEAACILYDAGIRTLDTERLIRFRSRHINGEYLRDPATSLWKVAETTFLGAGYGYFSEDKLELSRWLIDRGARKAWFHRGYRTSPAHLIPIAFLCRIYGTKVITFPEDLN